MYRTLAILGVGVWLLGASSSSRAWGQDVLPGHAAFGQRQPSTKYRLVDTRGERPVPVGQRIGSAGGISAHTLTEAERSTSGSLLVARGDGGGGDVTNFLLIQDRFLDSLCGFPADCGGPCNVVLMLWTENLENTAGVSISIDGNVLGTLPGLDGQALPGVNGVNIQGVPAGPHTFRAEDLAGGTFVECEIDVLDAQPFRDVTELKCQQGVVADDGTCEISVSWNNAGPFADRLGIVLDGAFLRTVAGSLLGVGITDLAAGEHCVDIYGFKEFSACAIYRSCFLRTCCTLTCEGQPCSPPQRLELCQFAYGPNPADNAVLASWTNGETNYTQVTTLLDDAVLGTRAGNATTAVITPVTPGPHDIGVQGDCGPPNGFSSITEATFTVLEATPHPTPITAAGVVCSFTPDPDAEGAETSTTTARWTNRDPSLFINVFAIIGPNTFFVGRLPGTMSEATVTNTSAADLLVLQFFANVNSSCHGSPLITCRPDTPSTNIYIQGMCNGIGAGPQISSAVFLLNFLFLGGTTPPCLKACDANGDGTGNLSDAVYVLAYLFLGGPPPSLWVDADADGAPDPTCTRAAPADDCEVSHDACSG